MQNHGLPAKNAPSEEEIRQQLARIIASSDFCASERNRRFLQHIADRTLGGKKTNGYEVGTQVFRRPASFNATTDPIVRIEASKLRRDLERYYLTAGRGDLVRITIPKGAYRMDFSYNKGRSVDAGLSRQTTALLRVALLGWAGQKSEAADAWRDFLSENPGFFSTAASRETLDAVCGGDDRVRELLSEGIRRASVS